MTFVDIHDTYVVKIDDSNGKLKGHKAYKADFFFISKIFVPQEAWHLWAYVCRNLVRILIM